MEKNVQINRSEDMKQKLNNTGGDHETSLPATSPEQQAFIWDDGEIPEKSSKVAAGLGPARKEPKRAPTPGVEPHKR